jgi:hypothetical protein
LFWLSENREALSMTRPVLSAAQAFAEAGRARQAVPVVGATEAVVGLA